jgi:hypothetical protein
VLFVELSRGIPNILLKSVVDDEAVKSSLSSLMQRNEISVKPEIKKVQRSSYPYWRFKNGAGVNILVCAVTPPCETMEIVKEPPGKHLSIDDSYSEKPDFLSPEILMDEALSNSKKSDSVLVSDEKSAALVYLPIAKIEYSTGEDEFTSYCECVTGELFYDSLPNSEHSEKSHTMALIALVSFLIFFLEVYKFSFGVNALLLPVTAVVQYHVLRLTLKRLGW